MLVSLAAADFNVVAGWRFEQEEALRAELRNLGEPDVGTLSESEIQRFVQHYQRLSEHILGEMPTRAVSSFDSTGCASQWRCYDPILCTGRHLMQSAPIKVCVAGPV